MAVVPHRIVQCDPRLRVHEGRAQLAEKEAREPGRMVRFQEQSSVSLILGNGQKLLSQIARRLEVATPVDRVPQPPQRREA